MLARTEKQKISQDAYMKKMRDIKVRVPEEYFDIISDYAEGKGLSVNKLIISLLEREMGIEIISIREQNKRDKLTKETE